MPVVILRNIVCMHSIFVTCGAMWNKKRKPFHFQQELLCMCTSSVFKNSIISTLPIEFLMYWIYSKIYWICRDHVLGTVILWTGEGAILLSCIFFHGMADLIWMQWSLEPTKLNALTIIKLILGVLLCVMGVNTVPFFFLPSLIWVSVFVCVTRGGGGPIFFPSEFNLSVCVCVCIWVDSLSIYCPRRTKFVRGLWNGLRTCVCPSVRAQNVKVCFSVISWPILILFVFADRAWWGLQNFYTEFWNSLIMQIYSKSTKNATSLFLGRFWFCLFYLIGLGGGFKTSTQNFEIH